MPITYKPIPVVGKDGLQGPPGKDGQHQVDYNFYIIFI